MIPNVTAPPNLLDIVRFGPYRPHGFVLGDHAWPQNVSNKSATSTINKANSSPADAGYYSRYQINGLDLTDMIHHVLWNRRGDKS